MKRPGYPNDLPPGARVYQQTPRWLRVGVFDVMAHDLRTLSRAAAGRAEEPTAAISDSRPLPTTPESGGRAGYDGAKRKKGSEVQPVVDTLGHSLTRRAESFIILARA